MIVQVFRTVLIALLMIGIQYAYAQTKPTKIFARPYKDSIVLRWHPYDIPLWEKNIKIGYDVYRKSSGGQLVKLNTAPVRALTPEEFPYRYLKFPDAPDSTKIPDPENYEMPDFQVSYTPDTMAMKAMIFQFPEEAGFDYSIPAYQEGDMIDFGNDKNAIRWLFHAILCYSSKEAAIVSGLYYMDKTAVRGERYTYYITTSGEGVEKALAKIEVASTDSYPIHKPENFYDYTHKRRSVITWKKADTNNVFIPVYDLYRSEKKAGPYVKINKTEILALYTGSSQRDSTVVSYSDTTLQPKKVYYYKARGMDVFGDYTEFSEPWMVTEKTLIEKAPYISNTAKLVNPFGGQVTWTVEPEEVENVAFFRVYRSKHPDTLFQAISPVLKKEERQYIDKSPSKNNYYKILTVGNGGDSLWTSPSYILIPDSIPPAASVMLEAVCDSNGVVKIKWKHNAEEDLHSFKLYRANYQNEEFSRVATIERIDTIYYDTLALNTLTEQVYYKILTYDDSYNPSPFSNVIKAKRYDIVPPVHPVFTQLRSDTSGIKLVWANSSSEDVVKTILFRKLRDESTWHQYKIFARDTATYTYFTDTSLYKGQWYEYTLQAVDDDQLSSTLAPIVQLRAFDDGFRPGVNNLQVKSSVRKKTVKLSWEYPYPGVQYFQIYRAKNDGSISILKSVDSGVFEYYDMEVGSGVKYIYKVKVVHKDGGESPMSKPIEVQF